MARSKRSSARAEAIKAILFDVWQFIFMLAFFGIVLLVWLVQAEAIDLPDWTRDWSGADDATRATYAAAMLTTVSLIFLFFAVAGLIQMRRESNLNKPTLV